MSAAPLLACALLVACSIEPNYLDREGPRYAGDHAGPEAPPDSPRRVVSYNLAFGRQVEAAIAALGTGALEGADLILMQEMDPDGVDRIAAALRLRYVYYPASIKHGRDWGNAILSRWPLLDDRKVLLPHADAYTNTRRIAVGARLSLGSRDLLVYSTHIATPALGLGARLDQIEAILDDAGEGTLALVGGDFNTAEPGSTGQVLDLLTSRGFAWISHRATGTASAFGRDATLDYIFARGLEPNGSGTFGGEAGSDHRPIWVELAAP
jgi:endonuclease/exonuclease/phosphatase (EEP) superfamily protein YafD